MTKEKIENILTAYGVAFTDTLASRLLLEFEHERDILAAAICDKYCRFPYTASEDDLPGICATCPLNEEPPEIDEETFHAMYEHALDYVAGIMLKGIAENENGQV